MPGTLLFELTVEDNQQWEVVVVVCVAVNTGRMGQGKGKEEQDSCSCPKYLVLSWPPPALTWTAHGYLSCSPVLHGCWGRSCLLPWGWPVSSDQHEELRRMWTWPSKYLLKMHKVQFIFGCLTKCRWIFHGGSKRGTSSIASHGRFQICYQELEGHYSLPSLPEISVDTERQHFPWSCSEKSWSILAEFF